MRWKLPWRVREELFHEVAQLAARLFRLRRQFASVQGQRPQCETPLVGRDPCNHPLAQFFGLGLARHELF